MLKDKDRNTIKKQNFLCSTQVSIDRERFVLKAITRWQKGYVRQGGASMT